MTFMSHVPLFARLCVRVRPSHPFLFSSWLHRKLLGGGSVLLQLSPPLDSLLPHDTYSRYRLRADSQVLTTHLHLFSALLADP